MDKAAAQKSSGSMFPPYRTTTTTKKKSRETHSSAFYSGENFSTDILNVVAERHTVFFTIDCVQKQPNYQ